MKHTIVILVILFILSFSGCGKQLKHPTKSRSEWSHDNEACQKLVHEMMQEGDTPPDPGHEMRLIRECMKKKGWHR